METNKIFLTNGGVVTVDEDMYEYLSRFKWQRSPQGYAYRCKSHGARGTQETILMHKIILPIDGLVDHINRDTLDNRRKNLRPATKQMNAINSKDYKNNTTGARNVVFDKARSKWIAAVTRDGKRHFVGRFDTPTEAEAAVKEFCEEYVATATTNSGR